MENTMLSDHFSLWEMTRSGTAVNLGIGNKPNKKQTEALRQLCLNILEPLRQRYGAIIITSGYRCPQVNAAVGGARHSQHCRGEAADIFVASREKTLKYFDFIRRETDFDQLILEPIGSSHKRWIHVSYTTSRPNRHQVIGKP